MDKGLAREIAEMIIDRYGNNPIRMGEIEYLLKEVKWYFDGIPLSTASIANRKCADAIRKGVFEAIESATNGTAAEA